MKRAVSFLAAMLFACIIALAGTPEEENTYPTSLRLFHIARSLNKNLVCYDVNLKDGRLNSQSPLNAYWINREEHPGQTGSLSFFQKKMAYGYKIVRGGDDFSEVTLTAYAGKTLKICRLRGRYVCTTTIDGKAAVLQSLYVKSRSGNPLSVDYVELRGVTIDAGDFVSEKVSR